MSAPEPPLHDTPSLWYLGTPWTAQDVRDALEKAEPTSDPDELKSRERAEADNNLYPSHLFAWARGAIRVVIECQSRPFPSRWGRDPLTGRKEHLLVLRTRTGVSESDLDESADIGSTLATDAQVAELRRQGWVVKWYKKAD